MTAEEVRVSSDIALLYHVEDILLCYGRIPGPKLATMITELEDTLRNIQVARKTEETL